jgi:lysophospholipase L1-like esterase
MRMVALGDSVTVGVGDRPSMVGDLGWAAHLARSLSCSTFVNLARTGARAHDVTTVQLPAALAESPDLSTILVGGNDALRSAFDPARVADRVGVAADCLRSAGSDVLVVLLHDPRRVLPGGGGVFGRVIAQRAAAINHHLTLAVCDIPGVLVLDPGQLGSTYEPCSWHVDRMHPSASGHRALAIAAGRRLSLRGWSSSAIEMAPVGSDGLWSTLLWLVRNGTPWFAKRSVDLVPELISVVLAERRSGVRTCS